MGSTITVYDRLQQAGERAETIAALMRAALLTWDREDAPVERLLALVEQAHEDASCIISALPLRKNLEAELDDDEGCPKDDHDRYGPDDGCHDARERPKGPPDANYLVALLIDEHVTKQPPSHKRAGCAVCSAIDRHDAARKAGG